MSRAGSLVARLRAIVARPAFIYLCAYALARGAQFLLIPLYTRRLTTIEYGHYALGQTLMSLFPGMMSLGLHSAVSRFYFDTKDVELGKAQAGSVARWHLLFAIASGVVMELGVLALWPERAFGIGGKHEISCLVLACTGSCIAIVPGSYLRARQRAIAASLMLILEFVAVLASGLFLVRVLNRGLRGAFEAYALAYGVMGIIGTIFILSMRGGLARPILTRAIPFSLPLIPHLLANQLQNVVDRWALATTGLDAQLGPYSLATQLTSPVMLLVGAYNDGASPQMGEAFRDGGLARVERGMGAVRKRYLLVAAAGGALVLCALPLAKLMVPSAYSAAFWISPFLCAVYLVESLYYPHMNAVYFASRTGMIPRITMSAAALNVALNFVCIRYMGVAGAVAARGASMTYRSIGMWLAARASFAAPAAAPVANAEIATEER